MPVTGSRKSAVNRRRLVFWAALLGVPAIAIALVYRTLDGVFWPITRLGRYATISGEYRQIPADRPAGTDLLAAFPVVLSSAARNARLYYWTPPGDVVLQLRCTLPASAVADLAGRWSPAALVTTRGSEQESGYYHGPADEHFFYVCDQPGSHLLPETYVVYTTAKGHTAIDARTRYSYDAGIAIDPKRNDVIYWLQGHAEEVAPGVQSAGATRPSPG